jgi:single-stranded-DNA-specific exonuclease
MLRTGKRWIIYPRISDEAELALGIFPPVIRQILYNREFRTMEQARGYLEARTPAGTDPFGMRGIPEAVDRLLRAIHKEESIAVYGDYDADGVTATALLVQALQALGADVRGYIPNRFDEGYGLNNDALDNLQSQGIRVVITVDCGIRSLEEARHARELGLDLIITDHHHPGAELPDALVVINPKQPEDSYPEKDLAGVGLAYKLASALIERLGSGKVGAKESYLDLVALGTVADLAPLKGENRSLVRIGLEYLRRPHRQGIQSLIGVAGLQSRQITATEIGFVLGPRLNAAGRLESALAALDLLTCTSPDTAGLLAQKLDVQNRDRQRIMQEIQAKAEQIALAEDPEALLLFACDESFNPGVVGLAASRLTESYYRPTIVAFRGEQYTRASCRSIAEFHITKALDQCADLLEHHGGHAAAAGFTVRNENLPILLERLKAIASQELSQLDLRPLLQADVEVRLSDLHPELLPYLDALQPTGFGNPQAYFISRDIKVKHSRTVGRENNHLKLSVTDGWITYDAIGFNLGHWQESMPASVDLLYTFERNEYNGRVSLQLKLRDLKPSGAPD